MLSPRFAVQRHLLPNAHSAVIPAEKLRDYVLSLEHPVGCFKAAFFATLGYGRQRWSKLAHDLREQHLTLRAVRVERSIHGTKYRIKGLLCGPSGRSAVVVSIWIIDETTVPRLVTLYPGDS